MRSLGRRRVLRNVTRPVRTRTVGRRGRRRGRHVAAALVVASLRRWCGVRGVLRCRSAIGVADGARPAVTDSVIRVGTRASGLRGAVVAAACSITIAASARPAPVIRRPGLVVALRGPVVAASITAVPETGLVLELERFRRGGGRAVGTIAIVPTRTGWRPVGRLGGCPHGTTGRRDLTAHGQERGAGEQGRGRGSRRLLLRGARGRARGHRGGRGAGRRAQRTVVERDATRRRRRRPSRPSPSSWR